MNRPDVVVAELSIFLALTHVRWPRGRLPGSTNRAGDSSSREHPPACPPSARDIEAIAAADDRANLAVKVTSSCNAFSAVPRGRPVDHEWVGGQKCRL
jgi:hypothetical protein